MKADAGVTKDSKGLVSQWQDQSGSGKDAVQAILTQQPKWMDHVVSGKPAIHFDGNNDNLRTLAFGAMPTYSVAFVIKPEGLNNYNFQIGPGAGKFLFHTTTTGEVYVGKTGVGDQRITPNDGLVAGTLALERWDRILFTYGNGVAKFYKNGALLASKDITSPDDWDAFAIGVVDTNTINGYVSELMVYNTVLSNVIESL